MVRWVDAVKAWNAKQKMVNAKHVFCMPRKGTPEHAAVMAHMKGSAAKKEEAAPAAKPVPKGEVVDLSKKPRGSKAKAKLAAKHTKMMAKEEAAGRSTQRDRILAILEEELGRRA